MIFGENYRLFVKRNVLHYFKSQMAPFRLLGVTVIAILNLRNKVDYNMYFSVRREQDNSENMRFKKLYNFYIKNEVWLILDIKH